MLAHVDFRVGDSNRIRFRLSQCLVAVRNTKSEAFVYLKVCGVARLSGRVPGGSTFVNQKSATVFPGGNPLHNRRGVGTLDRPAVWLPTYPVCVAAITEL